MRQKRRKEEDMKESGEKGTKQGGRGNTGNVKVLKKRRGEMRERKWIVSVCVCVWEGGVSARFGLSFSNMIGCVRER